MGPLYIISIAKTVSKKIGALIRSMNFFSPGVALYCHSSMYGILLSCLGWFPKLLLRIVRQATKWICRTVGPSIAAPVEPLAHRQNVAISRLSCRYYFGRFSSELAPLVPLPFSQGRSNCYPVRLHDFSVTIARCYKDVYVNSFFLDSIILCL